MEIERKWMTDSWPSQPLPLLYEQRMRQGYFTVRPTARIREEATVGGETHYVLCFKSLPTDGGLSRGEIEIDIPKEKFDALEDMIGLPLIPKIRRTYRLPDGLRLEVNHVDEGQPSEFWYAEIEYPSVEAARAWDPAKFGLENYLSDDVTGQPGQSMGAFWEYTRLQKMEKAPWEK